LGIEPKDERSTIPLDQTNGLVVGAIKSPSRYCLQVCLFAISRRRRSKGLPKRCHQSVKEPKLSHFSLLPFPAQSGASTIGETALYFLFIKMGDVTYGFFMPLGATNEACSFRAISCASEPGRGCFPRREKDSSPMIWRKIVGILERLDNYLSDGVYLHGCYLTGQEKIVRRYRQDEARDHLQDHSDLDRVHLTDVSQIDRRRNNRHGDSLFIDTGLPATRAVCAPTSKLGRQHSAFHC
jgi:hypothetical protein